MAGSEDGALELGALVTKRWRVVGRLGSGSFGDVYEVEAVGAGEGRRAAMKTESARANAQILKMEVLVLKRLNEARALHCCQLLARGRDSRLSFIVMTKTGPSLSQLRKRRPNKVFTLSTSLRLGLQGLDALEELHSIGFVHRDIKHGNLAVDLDERRLLVLLDFGLARSFRRADGSLRPERESVGFRGTVQFAPLAAHEGRDSARAEDLESWWYLLRDLCAPGLPWAAAASRKDVAASKRASAEDGRLFKGLPGQLRSALEYLLLLDWDDEPSYALLHTLLAQALLTLPGDSAQLSAPYDWHLPD